MATAAVGIGSALIGGYFQNKAAKDATKATTNASNQAIAQNQAMFQQVRGDLQPYMQGGQVGLQNLLGGYEASPFYAYQKKEMMDGLNARHAALGSLYSGGTDLDMARHINGLAAGDQAQWYGQQMGLAQLGQNSAAGVGAMGMNSANTIGSYLGAQGAAQAQGAINQGNNIANTVGQIGQGLGGLLGGSSYGGGNSASNFGLPAPVSPYANASYGTSGQWFS